MNKLLIWLVLAIVCLNSVFAVGSEVVSLSLLDQDPDPAGAGEIVKLRFSLANIGEAVVNGLEIELLPKYPFTKMSGEEYVKIIPQLSGYPATLKYQVLVDRDALEATNEIDVRYRLGPNDAWTKKTFEVDVNDIQTDFDLVIQEISGNEVSVAIANIGKNVAYSLILRVPEQDEYEVTGPAGQMIGNLEDGDYTLVTYQIAKKRGSTVGDLKFQMDYTDEIGERRTVYKTVPFELGGSAATTLPTTTPSSADFAAMRGARQRQVTQSVYQQWWFWAILIVVGFVINKLYKKKKAAKKKTH